MILQQPWLDLESRDALDTLGAARILAPNVRHRSKVVPATLGRRRRSHAQVRAHALGTAHREADDHRPTAPMTWMERLRRVFAIDLSACPHCGGRLRVIADVTRPDVILRIKRPSHGGRHTACREPAGAARTRPEPGLADRSLTPDGPRGLQARPEELQLPHRRCRMCAFCRGRRQPATRAAPTVRASAQFPRSRCSLHTPAQPMAGGLSCLSSDRS